MRAAENIVKHTCAVEVLQWDIFCLAENRDARDIILDLPLHVHKPERRESNYRLKQISAQGRRV